MRVGKRERDEGGKKRGGMWVGRRERDDGGKKRGGMRMGRRERDEGGKSYLASSWTLNENRWSNERKQMETLFETLAGKLTLDPTSKPPVVAIPSFVPFDSSSELWSDYWARFLTFIGANSVPDDRAAQIFLTNQSKVTYKLLGNLASQQTPPKDVNALTLDEIAAFMKTQFDPTRHVVRERYKFWSEMQRKPGETIQELAARIRHDAVRCDFPSIKDPQDEAMRTRFMCSVNNEAVLKALFKVKYDELTFAKALQIAQETRLPR